MDLVFEATGIADIADQLEKVFLHFMVGSWKVIYQAASKKSGNGCELVMVAKISRKEYLKSRKVDKVVGG